MSRDVCGICWCPYDGDGKCGCKSQGPVIGLDVCLDPDDGLKPKLYADRQQHKDEALLRQALSARVPDGWKLVPVEPTPEMKTAGIAVEVYPESKPEIGALTWEEVKAIYSAMLAAAPQPAGEPVASAVQTVIEAMQADPDYAWGWHCNIAMAFVDAGGSHYTANQGAARFMRMLANVEPAHELPAAPQPHPDDTALLRQALEFMNELLPATSEISAEHLSDPTLLRDLELRDAIMERLK